MPHGPDIAAATRPSTIDEGAADMARIQTRITTEQRRRAAPQFPTARRRNAGPVIRGAQTRSTTVRRPLRIPGR